MVDKIHGLMAKEIAMIIVELGFVHQELLNKLMDDIFNWMIDCKWHHIEIPETETLFSSFNRDNTNCIGHGTQLSLTNHNESCVTLEIFYDSFNNRCDVHIYE